MTEVVSESKETIFSFLSLSVPYSNFAEEPCSLDIYSGKESIPFEERDLLFKNILRKEFSNAIKEFSQKLDKLPISLI